MFLSSGTYLSGSGNFVRSIASLPMSVMPKNSLEWDIDIHVCKGGQGAPSWRGWKGMWVYPSEGHAPVAAELAHA